MTMPTGLRATRSCRIVTLGSISVPPGLTVRLWVIVVPASSTQVAPLGTVTFLPVPANVPSHAVVPAANGLAATGVGAVGVGVVGVGVPGPGWGCWGGGWCVVDPVPGAAGAAGCDACDVCHGATACVTGGGVETVGVEACGL